MNSTMTAAARVVTLVGCIAAAVYAVFVASSVVPVADWITNSDQLTIPALVIDIFTKPSDVLGWRLPRASYLFPDAIAYGLSYLLIRDPLDAIPLAQVPTLLVWTYLLYRLAPAAVPNRIPFRVVWAIVVGVLIPLVLTQFSTDVAWWITKYVFSFANHFACFVFSALLLLWTIDYLYEPSPWRLGALGVVLALVAASNRAVWIFFLLPMCAALFLAMLRSSRAIWGRVIAVAVTATASASIGYAVEGSFNRIEAMPYEASLSSYGRHAATFGETVWTYAGAHPLIAIALVAYGLFYLVTSYRLLVSRRAWWRGEMQRDHEKGWLYDAALLLGVVVDVLASIGSWETIGTARYLMPFFFAPALLARVVWRRSVAGRWLVGGAGCLFAASAYAFFASDHPARPASLGRNETKPMLACLASINVNRGLASYWTARRLTFLSEGKARVDQLVPWSADDGNFMFIWGNNAYSFLRGHPSIDPYDYIIVDTLDKNGLEKTFGRPDRIYRCDNHEVWKYEDQTKLFAKLFQRSLQPYERLLLKDWSVALPAAILRGETGSVNGLAREARAEADRPGLLIGGSQFHIKPGKYRIGIVYSYSEQSGGSGGKIGTFEIAESGGTQSVVADLLADSKQRHGEADVAINIDNPDAAIEPRVHYAGNGQLHVEQISIAETTRTADEIRLNAADGRLRTLVGVKEHGVVASTGRAGALLYGPYLPLAAGTYRASVYFVSTPSQHSVGTIDVVSDKGKSVLAQRPINPSSLAAWGSTHKVEFTFALTKPVRDLELRVFVDDAAVLEVSGYDIVPTN